MNLKQLLWLIALGGSHTPSEHTVTGNPVSFKTGYAEPMKLVIPFTPVQTGSGDPSPSNIRPITGRDGANIDVVGKNWLSFNSVSLNKDSKRTQTESISTIPAGTYIFSWEGSATYSTNFRFMNSSSIATVNVYGVEEKSVQVELTEDVNTLYMFISNNAPSGATCELTNMMLRLVSETDATYEAYQGATYPVTFASTCYGGTLTVHADGTGTLVVDTGIVDLGTLNWQNTSTGVTGKYRLRNQSLVSNMKAFANTENSNAICSAYKTLPAVYTIGGSTGVSLTQCIAIDEGGYIRVYDENYDDGGSSTPSAFKTAMNGVQFVYKLSTPTIYTLTVPQVLSLLGQNNVWTDTNGENQVTYIK